MTPTRLLIGQILVVLAIHHPGAVGGDPMGGRDARIPADGCATTRRFLDGAAARGN